MRRKGQFSGVQERRLIQIEAIASNKNFDREFRELKPWPKDLWFEDEKEIEPPSVIKLNKELTHSPYGCSTNATCESLRGLFS